MADNTRSKEMAAELRRQAEMLEKSEVAKTARFERIEEKKGLCTLTTHTTH